ncbi:DUF6038 family protein [Staphylococcus equorum]|uniref:DUF6038 family protein n=1 Tax=Staphylococcus equorum TaxID=246432 RepID=UPI000D1CF8FA|nr:DUF6038 family protein [Staphylococcus equorum]PTE82705.1 hypothetical protein BUY90_12345 [Staphylococcus equorum]
MNFENYKYFTGKDLMNECNLSEKMFKNSMDKLERVYKLDINRYKSNPSATRSSYSFNLFELELFKILLNTIDFFPVPTSAKKFDDEDLRAAALKNNNSQFISYITNITDSIDSIKNDALKAQIYASENYSSTLEWLSGQSKCNDALSSFFNYTNSLDLNKNSELYRKLAHRIDELLFETLMEDNLTYDNDFNFKQLYKAHQYDKENGSEDFIIYSGDESDNSNSGKHKVSRYISNESSIEKYSESTDNKLLDFFIIDILNKLYLQSLDKRVNHEIVSAGMHNEDYIEPKIREKVRRKEIIKYPFGVNGYFIGIENDYFVNHQRIINTIDWYKNRTFDLQSFETRLDNIINNSTPLVSNDKFLHLYKNFYLSLSKIANLFYINYQSYIDDGLSPNQLESFLSDLHRIHLLLDKYSYGTDLEPLSKIDHTELINSFQLFKKIKSPQIKDNMVSKQVNDLSSWSVAKALGETLNNLKSE